MSLARALYSALTWAAQPLLLRKLRRRAVAEPGYGHAVDERFGRYARPIDSLIPPSSADPLGSFVWIHAVSLGETRAAAILLAELRRQLPGMRLLLTHGTATGRAEGEKLLLPGDVQVWQPWDTPGAVRRFLRQFRPAIGILMETEVWPNLVAGCQQRGIPLVLANARLNATSLRKSQRLAALARPAYGGLAAVWAQTDADAERLQRMGAPVRGVFGNLKFDVVPDAAQLARGRAWRARSARPVVMLASSREGEEAMWLAALKQKFLIDKGTFSPCTPTVRAEPVEAGALSGNSPSTSPGRPGGIEDIAPIQPTSAEAYENGFIALHGEVSSGAGPVQWLVVPRHPQRFGEVQQLLRSAGLTVSCRSQWADAPEPADVWLGDSLGEMVMYYGLADVALLGGSFAPLGGQNLIEAIACGCPVVLGPHTFNFAEAATLACDQGVAHRVADIGQGVDLACDLASSPLRLTAARGLGQEFMQRHSGAARRTAVAIGALLGHPAAP